MSIILFATVGYIQAYLKEINISNIKSRTGNFEVVLKNLTLMEAEIAKNNVLVSNAGMYTEIKSSNKELSKDNQNSSFYMYAGDDVFLKDLFGESIKIEEGRIPTSSSEVIISEVGSIDLQKKVGDYVNINNKNYKIVGIFVHNDFFDYESVGGITFLDENIDQSIINIAINTKTKKNKYKSITSIAEAIDKKVKIDSYSEDVFLNNSLLYAYGDNNYYFNNKINFQNISISVAILMLSTFFVYGFINISIRERIQQFSILRCIGATPDKIRILLIKESIILTMISIVPGIIVSMIINYIIYYFFLKSIFHISIENVGFKVYPQVIIYVILFTIISIFISTIKPIIKVGNIEPINGIKNKEFSKKSLMGRKSKIIRKIFGYNGELAYKNIRGNSKYFILNIIIFTSLLSVFIIFTGFNKSLFEDYKREIALNKDITIDINHKRNNLNIVEEVNKYKQDILDMNVSKKIYTKIIYRIQGVFPNVKLNHGVKELSDEKIYGEKNLKIDNIEYVYSNNISLLILDDKYMESFLNENGNGKLYNNGVFIANGNSKLKKINKKTNSLFNIKEGEKLQLIPSKYQITDGKSELNKGQVNKLLKTNNAMELIYLGEVKAEDIINGEKYGIKNNTTLLLSQSFYLNNRNLFSDAKLEASNMDLTIELKEDLNREFEIRKIKNYSSLIGGFCVDNKVINNRYEVNSYITAMFVYLILGLSMVVGVINIINNKNVHIKFRSKEIGILLAIGISKKRLKDILLLEGVIQWLIASILSLSLSFVSLHIIYKLYDYTNNVHMKYIPIKESILGCVMLLFINILGSYLSTKKIDFTKTTELIKNDE